MVMLSHPHFFLIPPNVTASCLRSLEHAMPKDRHRYRCAPFWDSEPNQRVIADEDCFSRRSENDLLNLNVVALGTAVSGGYIFKWYLHFI